MNKNDTKKSEENKDMNTVVVMQQTRNSSSSTTSSSTSTSTSSTTTSRYDDDEEDLKLQQKLQQQLQQQERERLQRHGSMSYPAWHNTVAGGVAGAGSRMVTAPLDLIRIRRQLNFQSAAYPSESLWQSWKTIVETEGGMTALFRGNMAAIYLWVGYAAVQFSVYNHVKVVLQKSYDPSGQQHATKTAFVSGAMAGLCATVATYPFDVCRTTFAARGLEESSNSTAATTTPTTTTTSRPLQNTSSSSSSYSSLSSTNPASTAASSSKSSHPLPLHSLLEPHIDIPKSSILSSTGTSISNSVSSSVSSSSSNAPPKSFMEFAVLLYRQRGWRGFYAGVAPAAIQIIPYMGLNFAIYDWLTTTTTTTTTDNKKKRDKRVGLSAYAGSISGAVSKIIVYPMDTVKRRLQAQAFYYEPATTTSSVHHHHHHSAPRLQYAGTMDCIVRILAEEGWTSFYRGMVPSVLKTTIATGLSFSFYRFCKNLLEAVHDNQHHGTPITRRSTILRRE